MEREASLGLCILDTMGGPDDRQSDEDYAANIHDFRELVRTRDREGVESALASPEFFRQACDDERYLGIAMQGVSVLAWDEPAKASEHLLRFDVQRSREREGTAARAAARTLIAALEWWKFTRDSSEPMVVLREFLQMQPALPANSELGAELLSDMREHRERYLAFFESMFEKCYGLPKWLLDRNGDSSEDSSPVDALSPEQVCALSVAVVELRETLGRGMGRYALGFSMVATVLVLPSAAGVVLALLILLGYLAFGEGKSYEQVVRPRLARLAIEHGVGAQAVVSWVLKLRRQSGRMGHFDVRLANDSALDLLAAVAASALKTRAADDETPDDGILL